ncbi:MAG: LytR/AlgR family response regulator transcription factor [Caldimonas sp.]
MPTAIVADDEDLPRSELVRMLASAWPELEIVRECADGEAAAEAIDELGPDAAFLDIRMPGLGGLDVARAANGRCHCVFTTAHDEYAIEAFEAGAADYLLKPIAPERLKTSVERLRQRLAGRLAPPPLDGLIDALQARAREGAAAKPLKWISGRVGDTVKMFSIDEIVLFQSDEKYTRVATVDDEVYIRKPLAEILPGLDPEAFWQMNRGLVVRATAIARARRDEMGRYTLILKGRGESLAVSRAYAWRFRAM